TAIPPVTASLSADLYVGEEMLAYLKKHVKRLIIVDGDAVCEECGSSRVLNIVLLGAAIATGELDIGIDEMEQTIDAMVNEKYHEMNRKALFAGAELAGSMQVY
ncbi:MAG TPA: 2-oxoacid:acceptor oxidoreductase family protein, partial [Lachnospiraceae bacterium]|nr:2-oxoacid:acceptor oxidoreductase family protein [Lachnospiraceae bacterium]